MALQSQRGKPATHANQAVSSGSQMRSQVHWRVMNSASILFHIWGTALAAHLSNGYPDLQKEMPLVHHLPCCTKCCFVGTHYQQFCGDYKSYPRYLTSHMGVLMTRSESHNVLLTQQAFGNFTPASAPLCKRAVQALYHTEISNLPWLTPGKTSPSVLPCFKINLIILGQMKRFKHHKTLVTKDKNC